MPKTHEALRLADELDDMGPDHGNWSVLDEASSELRRLHKVNRDMVNSLRMCVIALEMAGVGDSKICKEARASLKQASEAENA